MTIVNYGLPLQAIASEGKSIFNFSFFRRNEIALDAYFGEDTEKTEEVNNVNDNAMITLEVSPKIEGYLKSGSLKFNLKNGNENNFKLISATMEEKEALELDDVDTQMLEESKAEKADAANISAPAAPVQAAPGTEYPGAGAPAAPMSPAPFPEGDGTEDLPF
mgnify:CR=1 FL=1